MNANLSTLQPYPFEKLAQLKSAVKAPLHLEHIPLSIGEPKHAAPEFVVNILHEQLHTLSNYPTTKGLPDLREAISSWATQRFKLKPGSLSANDHVLPVNGTREALFSFAQTVIDNKENKGTEKKPIVMMPNPFYQIYEGAALIAAAEPYFLNCTEESNFLPDFTSVEEETWNRCQLLFICTPGNPTGSLLSIEQMQHLIRLADKHNFIIASDECYSELYSDEQAPPAGLLQACSLMGRDNFERCVVFHSLSKRSNLPGLRSGFIAGDKDVISSFLLYRTYHGCAMPIYTQIASAAAWRDEEHVKQNRQLYRQKFLAVCDILSPVLPVTIPPASFYLWLHTPIADTAFAQHLFEQQNVTVLPGTFLARDTKAGNPGECRVRLALVAPLDACIEAAQRIKQYVDTIS